MNTEWFKPRTYRHFDQPIGQAFLRQVKKPDFVAAHSFSPLISRPSEIKRYKPDIRRTKSKVRAIMYACHRDSAIFSWYSHQLSARLEEFYASSGLAESVVAYRALGKANYHFSAEAYAFAQQTAPCTILAFDVTGFFDNLSHARLKQRLKELLGETELPNDWYALFRAITKFRYVEFSALKGHKDLSTRFTRPARGPIASVAELKRLGIPFLENGAHLSPSRPPNGAGIPQGTAISAMLSNVYMMAFDSAMKHFADRIGAFYRRYSDDILVICAAGDEGKCQAEVERLLKNEELEVSKAKTEVTMFDAKGTSSPRVAQYLGFSYYQGGAGLRPSSLSKTWRRMRNAVHSAKVRALKSGTPLKTKKLYKRFTSVYSPLQSRHLRNFPAYARRSASAFGSGQKVTKQLARLQRGLAAEIASAKEELSP